MRQGSGAEEILAVRRSRLEALVDAVAGDMRLGS
jgi:hypothetical protein